MEAKDSLRPNGAYERIRDLRGLGLEQLLDRDSRVNGRGYERLWLDLIAIDWHMTRLKKHYMKVRILVAKDCLHQKRAQEVLASSFHANLRSRRSPCWSREPF